MAKGSNASDTDGNKSTDSSFDSVQSGRNVTVVNSNVGMGKPGGGGPGRPTGTVPGAGLGRKKREARKGSKVGATQFAAKPVRPNVKCTRVPIYMARSEDNLLKARGLELIEQLGEGSYAKVYLCKKMVPKEEQKSTLVSFVMALKIIDSSKTSIEYAKKFLPRELSVLLKIKHPNIIKLYLLFQRKSKFYMAMRYAERGDLLEYILAHGLVTENRARYWANQIGTALEYLHTMNVVHRDIKTENILLTKCFNVKLCDFGFSRFIGHEEFSSTFCGSISYSPPEVLRTTSYDPKKSDMWSFGVVIFVMLFKRLPFRETENPKLLLAEQMQKSYVMPEKMEAVLSSQSKKVMKHLLEPNPKKRWGIQELLLSTWMTMDFRLTKKSPAEIEALAIAEEIGQEYNKTREEERKKEEEERRRREEGFGGRKGTLRITRAIHKQSLLQGGKSDTTSGSDTNKERPSLKTTSDTDKQKLGEESKKMADRETCKVCECICDDATCDGKCDKATGVKKMEAKRVAKKRALHRAAGIKVNKNNQYQHLWENGITFIQTPSDINIATNQAFSPLANKNAHDEINNETLPSKISINQETTRLPPTEQSSKQNSLKNKENFIKKHGSFKKGVHSIKDEVAVIYNQLMNNITKWRNQNKCLRTIDRDCILGNENDMKGNGPGNCPERTNVCRVE